MLPANITVVTFNRLALTKRCLESVLEKTPGDFALNVVDNASTDGTREYLPALAARTPRMRVRLLERNMGVAVGANLGWSMVDAACYIKLDNDVEILDPAWLDALLATLGNNPEIGMAGYLLCAWPHRLERLRLPGGDIFLSSAFCNGGCAAIPARVHEELGFWTEDYGKYGFEDVDYSDRVLARNLLAGYLEGGDKAVRHLGFEPGQVNEKYEGKKRGNTNSPDQGRRLYVLNKFLFSKGIRPMNVIRRYLPEDDGGTVKFRSNPAYAPILRIQQEWLPKIRYHGDESHTYVSFEDQPADKQPVTGEHHEGGRE